MSLTMFRAQWGPLTLCFAIAFGATVSAADQASSTPWNANGGPGVSTLATSADAGRFSYVLFWRDNDVATQKFNTAIQEATTQMSSPVSVVSAQVTDSRNADLVELFGADRAPLPLLIAIAPNGAVTKAWVNHVEANQLQEGIVSNGTAACLKAMQEQKLSLICVCNSQTTHSSKIRNAAKAFLADERFGAATVVIEIDPADQRERAFLGSLQVNPTISDATMLLVSPAGQMIGSFDGTATAAQVVAKIEAAQQSCCPGGVCGPEGCCPGGVCPPQEK
ncbi:hypothetical protein ACYFX5_07270 [Bremerella sp. T1]|uniref:hypothetical protein n=1 Tax=Bremerella sp. TYQ1 TaxID=3119568 RepID=UPI001CCE48DE|nr:hypothetical protein [Bremerella volcania]UBM38057.1 hypothetical protein LA756_09205 [Bremerella volcania]